MKFTITLNADNAAFDAEDWNEARASREEVHRVLARAAEQITDTTASGGSVRDSNGNTVCTWTCEEET